MRYIFIDVHVCICIYVYMHINIYMGSLFFVDMFMLFYLPNVLMFNVFFITGDLKDCC